MRWWRMSGRTPARATHGGNVLRMDQDAHLQGLREVTEEIERLRRLREDRILAAAEAEVPRKLIAEASGFSEPMVYKLRREALERRGGESG